MHEFADNLVLLYKSCKGRQIRRYESVHNKFVIFVSYHYHYDLGKMSIHLF